MILDQDLDRLADGELSPAERRELLQALETSPGDWRRCALAFVESQVLREELGAVAAGAAGSPVAPAERQRTRFASGGWLALAASVLVAFGAGSLSGRVWSPSAAPTMAGVEEEQVMPTVELPSPDDVQSAIAVRQQRADAPDEDVVTFWTSDDSGGRRSLRTRLVDADKLDERLGVRFRSAIPPEVRQRYEDQGYRFQSRQRYAPLNMDDGRVLVVPVEDLQVKPPADDYLQSTNPIAAARCARPNQRFQQEGTSHGKTLQDLRAADVARADPGDRVHNAGAAAGGRERRLAGSDRPRRRRPGRSGPRAAAGARRPCAAPGPISRPVLLDRHPRRRRERRAPRAPRPRGRRSAGP